MNPRASRTVPFVSKAIGVPMARAAALLAAGRSLESLGLPPERQPVDFFIKAPVFPFRKFPGEDVLLGPEMKSTGEVMGISPRFGDAFAKACEAVGTRLRSRAGRFRHSYTAACSDRPDLGDSVRPRATEVRERSARPG